MPYPTEHSGRITAPGQYDEIRRENDKFGPGIDAVYGIKDGKSEIQSIRFDKNKFTVEQAKAWLKEHDYKPILFEPASEPRTAAAANVHCAVIREGNGQDGWRLQEKAFGVPGVDIIYAVADDGSEQTREIQFDAKLFKPKQARAWLKTRNQPTITFLNAGDVIKASHTAIGVEVIRLGDFVDGSGTKFSVREKDLADMVRNFGNRAKVPNSESADVPMILGHEDKSKYLKVATDTPAAGWVDRFYVQGEKLLADIKNIPDSVAGWIKAKVYRKISLGMRRGKNGWTIFHVGLLGAAPPAVKGLSDFPTAKLTDGQDGIVILSVDVEKEGGKMTRKEAEAYLKKIKAKESLYASTVPDELVITLAEELEGADKKVEEAEAEKKAAEEKAAEAEKKAEEAAKAEGEKKPEGGDDKNAEAGKAKELNEDTAKTAEAATELLKSEFVKVRTKQASDVIEAAIKDGRVTPAEKDTLLAVTSSMVDDVDKIVECSIDGKKTKATRFDVFLASIHARPKTGAFEELGAEEIIEAAAAKVSVEVAKATKDAEKEWLDEEDIQAAYPQKADWVEGKLIEAGLKTVEHKDDKKEEK